MVGAVRDQDDLLAEPVQHDPHHAVVAAQADLALPAAEHAEVLGGVGGHVEGGAVQVLPLLQLQTGDGQLGHLVHPVVAHLLLGAVPAHQVVVLTVPDEAVGKDGVPPPVPAKDLLLPHVVVEVAEGHRLPGGQGGVELVDGVVDALVHGLDPPVHVDLPLELPGLVDAGETLQLADEVVALPFGDKFAGLHCVHQQLELRQLKGALPHEPARVLPLPALDVQSRLPQHLHVVVDALALGRDALGRQGIDEGLGGDGVLLVGALQQDLTEHQQLLFLSRPSGHGTSPLLCLSILPDKKSLKKDFSLARGGKFRFARRAGGRAVTGADRPPAAGCLFTRGKAHGTIHLSEV